MINTKRNHGFTLAEMLVVIVILAILTGLSVFGYRGWQQSIAQREVKSDLNMVATAMESAKNFGTGYPTSLPSSFKASSNVNVTLATSDGSSYCVSAVSANNPSIRFFVNSTTKTPTAGSCPVLGETWTAIAAPESNVWMSVTFGNGRFVAVSNTGTNRVMTSTDGLNWSIQSSAVAAAGNWDHIIYGGGRFVAIGSSTGTHRVMTSVDGLTWTAGTLGAYNWGALGYGNGVYVALNPNTPTTAYTSADGLTWTSTAGIPSGNWSAVAYGNSRFAAVALSGTNHLINSTNGTSWSLGSISSGTTANIGEVIYAGGKFVAAASSSTNNVMTSTDGITWTGTTVPGLGVGNGLSGLAYYNSTYVGVGNNKVMTSPDAVTWTSHTVPEANAWRSVTFGNGRLVAVAANGTNRIMVSQ
jgi:prepilin-type N-terminal cleavage/methylation domain-containing protein